MTDDSDSDGLIERMLDAARREAPGAGVKAQALRDAQPPAPSSWARWLLAALVVGSLGFVVVLIGETPKTELGAEPTRAQAQVQGLVEPPSAAASETPIAPAVSPPEATAASVDDKRTSKPHPTSLEDELTLLDSARRALNQGEHARALRELDTYERRSTTRRLGAEASLLRIQILAASGQTEAASTRASQFLAAHPDSPLAERAQRFIVSPARTPTEEGIHP